MFVSNFEKFKSHVDHEVKDAAPAIRMAAE
ncbi:hypothetical protein C981_01928 [Brucella abortus 78/32]|nr:hypothetical protein [Brucella abortus]ENP41939.1 hypothetical protein C055_01860 [Brucella abortus 78/36]ENR88343.1 hypothetical protein C981_01928 [Brucella abortus 78/32]ENR91888.1 hypothetical protein C043_01920 [Brucella abortus 80/101]